MRNFFKDCYTAIVGVSLWYVLMLFTFILFIPISVFAQEVAATPPMPSPDSFFEALSNRHWPLAVAFAVTILVWIVRYVVKDRIPTKVIPYVMLACTVLSTTAARMIQFVGESRPWWQGMIQGVLEGGTIGLGSMGMWSAGAKKALPTPPKAE